MTVLETKIVIKSYFGLKDYPNDDGTRGFWKNMGDQICPFLCKLELPFTAQKMSFSIQDFFSKCDQFRSFLWIWSRLLKKSLMEKFIFCAVFAIFQSSGKAPFSNERLNKYYEG